MPPGRLRWQPVGELWAFDESGPPEWTLDSLAAAAQAEGIEVGRSQVHTALSRSAVDAVDLGSGSRETEPQQLMA